MYSIRTALRRSCRVPFQHRVRPVPARIARVTKTCKSLKNQERMMRSSHHVTGLKAAIGTAGLVAGVMLGGGISGEPGPAPQATGTAASSQPSAPEPVTSSRIVPVPGVFAPQPPAAGLMAIVIPDPPPGNPPGPRAIVAADISGAGLARVPSS